MMPEGRHVLMAMFQGGGNIPLLLPIATRLVTRGHRVRVLVGPGVHRRTCLWRTSSSSGRWWLPRR